jgi:RimJ/RimL family protein N-acetyltransferase
MRHKHRVDGLAFSLRPVEESDAEFMLALRTHPQLNRFVRPGARSVDEQLAWLKSYFARDGDFCFIVERQKGRAPEGVIALYDVASDYSTAEWGRWMLNQGSFAAPESARLLYRFAFETLGIDTVFCRTLAENAAVVSFHDSCAASARLDIPQFVELAGRQHDAVEHRFTRATWQTIDSALAKPSELAARRLNRA